VNFVEARPPFVRLDRARYRRGMNVAPLPRSRLAEAELVLADACAFDRATEVADETLFGPGPTSAAQAFGAWHGDELIGVAAVAARWLRVIAVVPRARRAGAGSALLAACESAARSEGMPTLSALDQPGNYLAPGIDERNHDAIAWLAKRGWQRRGDARTNLLIDLRGNPRVSAARAAELAERAASRGYEIRRARPDERAALCAAVAAEFGGAWHYEVERALASEPAGVHVAVELTATRDPSRVHVAVERTPTHDPRRVHVATRAAEPHATYCAFAAHDGNNRGLGWFGPTGTWPAHRGKGLGEALLMACLVDIAAERSQCEVAWIGPRAFYDKVAGIAGERRFVPMIKQLS
jgi:GNAT superfamily N-acetyltransferase